MIPARRLVTGTPVDAEQALDLAPAAQVGGQVVGVVAEPAQVDDLAQARSGRGPGEAAGRGGVARWKSASSREWTR